VTNHDGTASKNGLFLYEFPASGSLFDTSVEWTKRVLDSNFPITQKGMNQASPGQVYYVNGNIFLSGDGSQSAYYYTYGTGYEVTRNLLIKTSGVVGTLEVADVNHDGYLDIFVPDYTDDIVHVFTAAPLN